MCINGKSLSIEHYMILQQHSSWQIKIYELEKMGTNWNIRLNCGGESEDIEGAKLKQYYFIKNILYVFHYEKNIEKGEGAIFYFFKVCPKKWF